MMEGGEKDGGGAVGAFIGGAAAVELPGQQGAGGLARPRGDGLAHHVELLADMVAQAEHQRLEQRLLAGEMVE